MQTTAVAECSMQMRRSEDGWRLRGESRRERGSGFKPVVCCGLCASCVQDDARSSQRFGSERYSASRRDGSCAQASPRCCWYMRSCAVSDPNLVFCSNWLVFLNKSEHSDQIAFSVVFFFSGIFFPDKVFLQSWQIFKQSVQIVQNE